MVIEESSTFAYRREGLVLLGLFSSSFTLLLVLICLRCDVVETLRILPIRALHIFIDLNRQCPRRMRSPHLQWFLGQ